MKLKLSKNFLRYALLCVGIFILGFFIAQVFSGGETEKSGSNFLDGGPIEKVERRPVNVLAIVIIVLVIGAMVAYGYYTEKKKKN